MDELPSLKPGDMVHTRSFTSYDNGLQLTFSPGKKGVYMTFLFLGSSTVKEQIDPIKRLEELGFIRKPIFHKPDELHKIEEAPASNTTKQTTPRSKKRL